MTTQVQSIKVAQQETVLFNTCLNLYREIFPRLEELGWEEVEACGFAVFSRIINDVEYTLNMDMCQVLVHVIEQGITPEAIRLQQELEALPEWVALQEPVQEWKEFRTKYWLSSSLS